MAKGRKCPQCGTNMYALTEDYQPAGTWVVYQCLKCKFELKEFEDKKR